MTTETLRLATKRSITYKMTLHHKLTQEL